MGCGPTASRRAVAYSPDQTMCREVMSRILRCVTAYTNLMRPAGRVNNDAVRRARKPPRRARIALQALDTWEPMRPVLPASGRGAERVRC